MSWYSSNFRQRKAISVLNTSGGSTIDWELIIPPDWDEFWDAIDSDGEELRVTAADGHTLVFYNIDDGSLGAFDKANREGRIRVDGADGYDITDSTLLFWLYFDTETPAGDGETLVVITSEEIGQIDRGSPAWMGASAEPERVGTERPRHTFTKDSSELIHIWFDLSSMLEERHEPYAGRRDYEEPRLVSYTFVDETDTGAPSLVDEGGVRFVEIVRRGGNQRRLFLRLPVDGGTDGTNYTLRATLHTEVPSQTGHRILRLSAGVRVLDKLEPAT